MKQEDIEAREIGFLNQEDERGYKVFKFKNVPSQYSKNLQDDKWEVNTEFDIYKLNEDAYMKPLYEKYKERITKDIKANKEMYGTKEEPIKSDCIELIQKVVYLFSPNIDTEKEQQQEDCLNECQKYLDEHKPKDEYEQLRDGVNKLLDESDVSEETKKDWRNFTDDFIKRMKNK